jgi:hypothetical protein
MADMEPGIVMQHQLSLCQFFVPLLDLLMKLFELLYCHQFSNDDLMTCRAVSADQSMLF